MIVEAITPESRCAKFSGKLRLEPREEEFFLPLSAVQ